MPLTGATSRQPCSAALQGCHADSETSKQACATTAASLRLQAPEESIHHHLRDAPHEPLTEAGDRAAGLHGSTHVDDGGCAVAAKSDRGRALDEPRPSLPLD